MAILHGLTHAQYLQLPGWNWSRIKLLEDKSPRHVKHASEHPDNDTAARGMLRAVHALVLEPDNFGAQYSVFAGRRTGRAFEEHCAAHPGATVLNAREYDLARAAADAIRSHAVVARLLSTGSPEVSITWLDGETGLPCKGRVDWLGAALVDLKTLGTTNERSVASLVAKNLYHGQLAHYDDGLRAHEIEVPAFIVVAEGKEAHDVAVFEVDEGIPDGSLTVGRKLRDRLMRKLADCVALDHWPGRHPTAQTLCLPAYALDDANDEVTFALPEGDAEGANNEGGL
jgi:hypothetical protein